MRFVLTIPILFLISTNAVCQADLRWHKVSCLAGAAQVCSGDICIGKQTYGPDDQITVELRDKTGETILDSTSLVLETSIQEGTTQSGAETEYQKSERRFRFEGKPDGRYVLAFLFYQNGIPRQASRFPTIYSHKSRKLCDSIYMLQPSVNMAR
jgi:hypothetical protein